MTSLADTAWCSMEVMARYGIAGGQRREFHAKKMAGNERERGGGGGEATGRAHRTYRRTGVEAQVGPDRHQTLPRVPCHAGRARDGVHLAPVDAHCSCPCELVWTAGPGSTGSSSRRAGAMEGWGKSERSSPASPCDQPAGVNQYRESACSKQTGMAIPGDASDIHTGSRLALSAAELPATEERPSFIRPWRNPVNHRLPAVASKHVTRHELQRRRSRRCHLFALGRRTSASLSGSWPESGDGDFQICPPPGARIPVTGGIMRLTRAETLPSPRGSDLSEPLPLCLGAKHQGSIALDLAPPPPPPPSGKRQLL